MTTTKLSLDYPIEIVDEYFNLGFQGIFLRNISPYGFALRTDKSKYETDKFYHFTKKLLIEFWSIILTVIISQKI
jgi:hypothetical protein